MGVTDLSFHHRYAIREIRDPKGLLGIVDRAVLLLPEDKKAMFDRRAIGNFRWVTVFKRDHCGA